MIFKSITLSLTALAMSSTAAFAGSLANQQAEPPVVVAATPIELLSNLVFEGSRSCSDLVWVYGFNSVFEPDAGDDFSEVIKAA